MSAASAPAQLPRRAALVGGMIGPAAAWALAGCAATERDTLHPPVPQPQDDLARLRDGSDPIVAGEPLNGSLLRRFYARRGFEPVWEPRQGHADALADAVLRATDHGLDPELFHAGLLLRKATFPALRRELLLSHAVLLYAEALAFGAVPVDRRKDGEALAPEPLDVAAVLDAALDGPDPVAAIEALAPRTPTYQALRQALRRHRSVGRLDQAFAGRLSLIEANLERQRWLPRRLPADRVWVNVADQRLVLYRDDRPVFTSRVAVGAETERKQSPEFRADIEGAFFNPPWVIPSDIVEAYILPRLDQDPEFLMRNNITLLPNGEAEQAPGPTAGLGVILFDMPNRFDVFLHDTPNRSAFNGENRRISNGCIRVDNPLELAAVLMDQPLNTIQKEVAKGDTVRKPLPKPVPVFVVYQTAFASADQELEIRPDFYGRDAAVWRHLQKRPPE
ncbi:MAG: L,D-transpeptidase family protein [Roseomonas sp.]|nr:L,D-transpeptidase family protein [Roseomonas sp.]